MATTRDAIRLDGRAELRPGREVTISGLGRCRFGRAVVDEESGEVLWLDVFDRRNGGQHSIRPERVTQVHVKAKLR